MITKENIKAGSLAYMTSEGTIIEDPRVKEERERVNSLMRIVGLFIYKYGIEIESQDS